MSYYIGSQLAGADKVIVGLTKNEMIAACAALLTCEQHSGCHHFAIIREGKVIALSDTAVQCLKDQGVNLS